MINMSYCRFQNTLLALRECKNALREMECGNDEDFSLDEKEACIRLTEEAVEFIEVLNEKLDIPTDWIRDTVEMISEQAAKYNEDEDEDEDEDVRQGK